MDIRDRRTLKSTALRLLGAAEYDPRRLVLLHTGAALLLSLLVTTADFLLSRAISGTAGLGGLGTRSVLRTLQSCLLLSQLAVLPFWQAGYQWASLRLARGSTPYPRDLLTGFRLFFPLLRLLGAQAAVYLVVAMVAGYLGAFLFLLTPYASPLLEAALPLMQGGADPQALYPVLEGLLQEMSLPMTVCGMLLFVPLAAPFFYHFRMAAYVLLEQPERGALRAMGASWKIMRGSCLPLLRLDLQLLWYPLLELLITAVCYGDQLLPLLGISLPLSEAAGFFLFFAASLVLQLGLSLWQQNRVSVTYALFYTALDTPQPVRAAAKRTQPWNYR